MKETKTTETEWAERFKPITNPNGDGSWDNCKFETYGDDYAKVMDALAKDPRTVWTITITDTDEGTSIGVGDGWHWVNRDGYLITEVPCPDDETVYFEELYPEDDEGNLLP